MRVCADCGRGATDDPGAVEVKSSFCLQQAHSGRHSLRLVIVSQYRLGQTRRCRRRKHRREHYHCQLRAPLHS